MHLGYVAVKIISTPKWQNVCSCNKEKQNSAPKGRNKPIWAKLNSLH